MMQRSLSLIVLTLGLLVPVAAGAYVTPEDMLEEGTMSTRFFTPPPTAREAESIVEAQNKRAAERRAAQMSSVVGNGISSSSASSKASEATHEAASELTGIEALIQALQGLTGTAGATETPLATEDQRIIERIRAQQEEEERNAAYEQYGWSDGETLHSGAPLSDTGPATTIALLVIAAAVTFTILRAWNMEHIKD